MAAKEVQEFDNACHAFVNAARVVHSSNHPDICNYSITQNNGVVLRVRKPELVSEFKSVVEKYLRPGTLNTETKGRETIFTFRIQRG